MLEGELAGSNGASPHTWDTILRTISLKSIPYLPVMLRTVCDKEIIMCLDVTILTPQGRF